MCTYQCHEEEAKRGNFYFSVAGTSFEESTSTSMAQFLKPKLRTTSIGREALAEERHRREEVARHRTSCLSRRYIDKKDKVSTEN